MASIRLCNTSVMYRGALDEYECTCELSPRVALAATDSMACCRPLCESDANEVNTMYSTNHDVSCDNAAKYAITREVPC